MMLDCRRHSELPERRHRQQIPAHLPVNTYRHQPDANVAASVPTSCQ